MAEVKTYITELIKDLNSDKLDNQHGSYYLDWTNTTNKPDPTVTVTLTGDVTGTASATLTDLASGTVTVATTIAANAVALGTDTTGNYVATLSSTDTHLTISNSGTETAAVTIVTDATALDTASAIVARDANRTFDIGGIDFNTTSIPASAVGRLTWNDGDGTLDIGLAGGNVVLQVGQENVIRINNNISPATTLTEGTVVYVTGAQGQRLTVAKGIATSDATSARTIGVVTESIASGADGFIATSGLVRGLTTDVDSNGTATTEGQAVWLSPTIAGGWTVTKPSAPDHMVLVGWIVRKHASSGSIFVHVQNGFEIEELHNVKITNPQHSDVLLYDSAGYYWKNVSFSESVDDRVYSLFVAGTNVQLAYDDTANTFTINAVHTHPSSAITDFSEAVDDRVYSLFVAGTNVQLAYDDTANTFTINAVHTHTSAAITDFATAVDNEAYSYLVTGTRVAQFTHTHTSTDITNFSEAVDDEVYSLLVAGTNITLNYNDAGNTLTINASTNATTLNNQAASYYLDTSSTAQTKTGNLTVTKALSSDTAGSNAGAPSFSFSNDPDTGIYSSAANTLNFSAGNSNRLSISNTAFTIAASTTISAGSNKITNVTDPTSAQDAATKNYVDNKTYTSSAITDFTESVQDTLNPSAGFLVAGSGINLTYSDSLNTLTVSSAGGPVSQEFDIGDGTNTSFVKTHNFGTRDIIATIYDNSTYEVVLADVQFTTVNTVTISFASAPATNQFKLVLKSVLTTKYTADVGNGTNTSYTINHGLASRDVITTVYRNSSPYGVYTLVDVFNTTSDTVTLTFASAPSFNEYRVVIGK